ncbi:hypothetical protein WA158_005509 [Blastocystis sp. Blastoise]
MDLLKTLVSVDDIQGLLEQTKSEENTIQNIIRYHLQNEQEFLDNPDPIDSLVPINVDLLHFNKEFQTIGDNIKSSYPSIIAVNKQISVCGSEAVKSSQKVKQCDLLKKNAGTCLEIVDALIDLNKSVSGIQNSLQNEQYEEATDYIVKFKAALGTGDVADTDRTLMKTAQDELVQTLSSQLNKSETAKDFKEMLRYSKLLDVLGEGENPLQKCVNYITNSLSSQIDTQWSDASNTITSQDTGKDCADILGKLYKLVVNQLTEIEDSFIHAFPNHSYGYGTLLRSVYILCDEKSCRIYQLYINKKDLRSMETETKSILETLINKKEGTTEEMLNTIDNILNEISLLLQYSENFDRYIRGRGKELLQNISNQSNSVERVESASSILPKNYLNTSFFPANQERTNFAIFNSIYKSYQVLEEFYIVYNMLQAEYREAVDMDSYITTYVDDVFYIYKHSITRVLAQGNIKNFTQVLKLIKGSLEQYMNSVYMTVLRGKRSFDDKYFSSTTPLTKDQLSYLIVINNAFLSKQYLNTLITYISNQSIQTFTTLSAPMKKPIEELNSQGNTLLQEVYDFGVSRIREIVISPSIAQFERLFLSASYNLSEAEFSSIQLVDPFMMQYASQFKTTVLNYFNYLLPDIQEQLSNDICKQFATKIEIILYKKKFTQLGGIQLDKDMRLLVQTLKDMKCTTTRTTFIKINQMISILNMDNPKDAFQYVLNDSLTKQVLSRHDINKVIKLRVDS